MIIYGKNSHLTMEHLTAGVHVEVHGHNCGWTQGVITGRGRKYAKLGTGFWRLDPSAVYAAACPIPSWEAADALGRFLRGVAAPAGERP